jgi:hypothetical protein
MARHPRGAPPSYCRHKQSGQAVFHWPLGNRKYRSILLGPFGSPQSHAEYQRLLTEWRSATIAGGIGSTSLGVGVAGEAAAALTS